MDWKDVVTLIRTLWPALQFGLTDPESPLPSSTRCRVEVYPERKECLIEFGRGTIWFTDEGTGFRQAWYAGPRDVPLDPYPDDRFLYTHTVWPETIVATFISLSWSSLASVVEYPQRPDEVFGLKWTGAIVGAWIGREVSVLQVSDFVNFIRVNGTVAGIPFQTEFDPRVMSRRRWSDLRGEFATALRTALAAHGL